MKEPIIGILMLDHDLTRPPGDPGNSATFPFPVRHEIVPGVSLERLLQNDPTILEPLTRASRKLIQEGAAAIASGCGFFIYFQQQMAARLPVPVMLSSLLQIPFVQRTLGPKEQIGVLTAHAGRLSREHLLMAGMDPAHPVTVMGLENGPHFHRAVLTERGGLNFDGVKAEVVAKAKELVAPDEEGRRVGAIIMECTNLPPFAAAVQDICGLPVYDVTTMISFMHSALLRRPFHER